MEGTDSNVGIMYLSHTEEKTVHTEPSLLSLKPDHFFFISHGSQVI